ncbi:MAG TPA: hypothetical protein PKX07_14505 [Aggregatilineales bacterium]|nr:hypothetical protein [Aggregatilineales bacterium]
MSAMSYSAATPAGSMVTDLSPWADGRGFHGGKEWWDYIARKDERKRLDHLFGMALLDESIRRRLVDDRDESLFTAFGLSEPTKQYIRRINAGSLSDLAQAVCETFKATA